MAKDTTEEHRSRIVEEHSVFLDYLCHCQFSVKFMCGIHRHTMVVSNKDFRNIIETAIRSQKCMEGFTW